MSKITEKYNLIPNYHYNVRRYDLENYIIEIIKEKTGVELTKDDFSIIIDEETGRLGLYIEEELDENILTSISEALYDTDELYTLMDVVLSIIFTDCNNANVYGSAMYDHYEDSYDDKFFEVIIYTK